MKKKFFAVMLTATMIASLAGCGKKNTIDKTDTSNQEITAEQYADVIKSNADIYKTYVTMPEYAGIEVEVDKSLLEVSDEDVQEYIDSVLQSYGTTESVKEGVTKKGDVIKLDYSGKLDGKAFSGGTATDASYTVGSGKFIEDLDKGLIGLTVGKEYDIPCTFPSTYSSSDLAGKDVIFTVTVNSIEVTTLPELTDDWVAKNKDDLGVEDATVEGMRKQTRTYLEENAKINYDSAKYYEILEVLLDKVEVKGYPEKELNSLKETLKNNVKSEYENYKTYYESQGISSYEAYLSSYYKCENEEAFEKYADENAKSYLDEKMMLTIIAADNNLSVTADEINEMGESLAEYYGYDSYSEILKEFGNVMNSEVGYELMYEKAVNLLNEKAVEIEKTESESESATAAK